MRRHHRVVALSARCGLVLLMILPFNPSPALDGRDSGSLVDPPHRVAAHPGPAIHAVANSACDTERAVVGLGRVPISFEANEGQADGRIEYYSRRPDFGLYLTAAEAIFTFPTRSGLESRLQPEDSVSRASSPRSGQDFSTVVSMRFLGANPDATLVGEQEEPARSHYLLGNDRRSWHTNVPRFSRVRYENIYPGIDLVLYGQQRELEYDFVVAPGAHPEGIRLDFAGDVEKVIDPGGNLVFNTPAGDIRQRKPEIYQLIGDERVAVAGSFSVLGEEVVSGIPHHTVGFQLGAYDRSRSLVIDPALSFATYLGGRDYDFAHSIAVDAEGNTYITGWTSSIDFPVLNPLQQRNGGGFSDVFITKLNSTGTAVVYSTYVGGGGLDDGYGIVVDNEGNAYVTGLTNSINFPTVNALQPRLRSSTDRDAFILKLNPMGSGLVYSTYLGGSGGDAGRAISLSADGSVIVAGETNSTNFPTAKPIQPRPGGSVDGFIAELSPGGNALSFSSYLGGRADDFAEAITGDRAGVIFVTGETSSFNFLTANAFQAMHGGGLFDAFVAKIDTSDSRLVYSTYLGGRGNEFGSGIVTDSSGNAYVAGWTLSLDFPTAHPFQSMNKGGSDAFIAKLSSDGADMLYSSYLGGGDADNGMSIVLDPSGNVVMAGLTSSKDFPLVESLRPELGGGGDLFVTKLNRSGTALLFSTFLGGDGADGLGGAALAVDQNGDLYVADVTMSTDFPTTPGAVQRSYRGGPSDSFVAKIADRARPASTRRISGMDGH